MNRWLIDADGQPPDDGNPDTGNAGRFLSDFRKRQASQQSPPASTPIEGKPVVIPP